MGEKKSAKPCKTATQWIKLEHLLKRPLWEMAASYTQALWKCWMSIK
jgi:hypothetical protein